MKTAFIQNISHEVRTPLNIIGGFSQVIANPDIDPGIEERREIARMTQKNARLITTLIDEMLLVSLNESTEGAKKENQIEINNLMRGVMKEAESNLSSKTKIQYDTTLADDFTILTNEYMLKIIVNALVDNAAKNTPKGIIVLRATKPSDDELDLIVEDTGCGIPAAEAEHIFERFVGHRPGSPPLSYAYREAWRHRPSRHHLHPGCPIRCHITYYIIYDTETIHDSPCMPDGPR